MAAMDLTSYTGLQAAVASFLGRSDLSDEIPGFITLCEADIKRNVRRKTVRGQLDVSDEETSLPSDCSELRSIAPIAPRFGKPLPIGTPESLAEINARRQGTQGCPQGAAVIDGKLIVAPMPDTVYTFQTTYYKALTPLSATAATNDVLAEAPDIYLYGTLVHSAPFLQHDERMPMWKQEYEEAVEDLNEKRQREELNASYKKARLPVSF